MKLFSDACEYAIRSVVWLGQQPQAPYKVREIALAIDAASGYLIKVLQQLTRQNILAAQRGSHGGFRLLRDPATLTVLEIINAIDPMVRIHTCPLKIEAHGKNLCSMHRSIDDAMASVEACFGNSTILELMNTTSPHAPWS